MPQPLQHFSPRESLLADIGQVRDLIEAKEYARAAELASRVLVDAKASGIESAQATWMAAVARDYAGDLEAAFIAAAEAVRLDPLSPEYENSWEVIARRIRQALSSPDRAPNDPTTPRLYALLLNAEQADGTSHLQHARYLQSIGKPKEALRVLDALTQCWPTYRAAWKLMKEIAREVDDAPRLVEAEARLNGRSDTALAPGIEPKTLR